MLENLARPANLPTAAENQSEVRRQLEDFVRNCQLKLPKEVAQLFINYTRWIWDYKCIGAIYKYYYDYTVFHGANGHQSVGVEPIIAGTLKSISAFPDQIVEFVDIFVEGNEEDGYSFGQSTVIRLKNTGWSEYGPPTQKELGADGNPFHSICELTLRKIDGRWRVFEEWVVEGTTVWQETLTMDSLDAAELISLDECQAIEEVEED